jgi:23S rRNA pseudouridine1911/1915/1917 synthase
MYFSRTLSLFEAACLLCPDSSKTRVKEFIQQGRIFVDGAPVTKATFEVPIGASVELMPKTHSFVDNLAIVYEDPWLIVIDKPPGLLSVASNFEKLETAHNLVKRHVVPKKVFVIHRLDVETSGLMVFAKDQKAFTGLKEELACRKMKRVYYGVVEGELVGSGTWTNRLVEDADYRVHVTDSPDEGELATTHYQVEVVKKGFSLVRFTLDTGKKNQIRVQAAYAGHPLVGDSKYGSTSDQLGRLALHASELSFFHPIKKKKCVFSSPPPSQFRAFFL